MMRTMIRWAAFGMAAACLPAVAAAQTRSSIARPATAPVALVDNPVYAAWAKCKVGSMSAWTMSVDDPGGVKLDTTGTTTLAARTANWATLRLTIQTNGFSPPANLSPVPVKVAADAVKRTGTADVTAAGKHFACVIYDVKPAALGMPADDDQSFTLSLSADVPGGIVKAVQHRAGGSDITMTLTRFDAK